MAYVGLHLGSELISRTNSVSLSSSTYVTGATEGLVCRISSLCARPTLTRCGKRQSRSRSGTVSLNCEAIEDGAMSWNSAQGGPEVGSEKYRLKLESLLYCGKGIPEEKIVKPTGVPKEALSIGTRPRCSNCEAKGAVECPTCAGSGLYVDSILESQGIIVKMKCLGCGGTGCTMCPTCGGRGHT